MVEEVESGLQDREGIQSGRQTNRAVQRALINHIL